MTNLYRGHQTRNRRKRQSTNVIYLRPAPVKDLVRPFDALTAQIVLQQHRAGTLNPAVVEALLAGVGLKP